MICTFCGTENPKGNRFCGMCGVRLERRETERRIESRGSQACADCDHVNEPGHKFCGMCGARIDRRMHERRSGTETSRATARANMQLPKPESRGTGGQRQPETARASSSVLLGDRDRSEFGPGSRSQHEAPMSVSGPSFLGLNDPSAETEYLLEDVRPPRRGLRAFLLLIVLAAIVGLIFVQYRSSLKANPRSPETPNPGPATVPRPEGKNRPPMQDKGLQTAVAVRNLESAVLGVAKATSLPMNASADPPPKKADLPPKKKGGIQDDPPAADTAANAADPPAPAVNDKPSPALVKAQKYLHGQGVRRNCEQGLIYLRAAARENDPGAAVQMGALYSSGLCVDRDRVKAYEWFNSAKELEPENHWIQKNLNELWAQMSPQERHQIHQ